MGIFDQSEFEVRCEWGERGVALLAPISDAVIIVDVLSFSTCVDIAVSRGAAVYPYRFRDETAATFAASIGAELADARRNGSGFTLSPQSLLQIPKDARLVLPSPNGSALTLATASTPTLAGCLRNARAVAQAARKFGRRIAVIPAGERWPPIVAVGGWREGGGLRPALEDLVGAGAIIAHLDGGLSPEARAALVAFQDAQAELGARLRQCSSGKELIERGFEEDVALAAELNASACAPLLVNGAYTRSPVDR